MVPTQLHSPTSQADSPRPAPPYDPNASRKLGALRGLGRRLDAQDPRVIREAATLLTSQLFFAPLLAEMRKLPFGKHFSHGGRTEEAFGEQLDLHIADAVARSDRGFTPRLAEQLAASRGASANAGTGSATPQRVTWPAVLQARQPIERSKH